MMTFCNFCLMFCYLFYEEISLSFIINEKECYKTNEIVEHDKMSYIFVLCFVTYFIKNIIASDNK